MEDIEKLKETFYSEADDILSNLDELLLRLEQDPSDRETLDAVFRDMHTLKGSSGIFEFHAVERLAHACEDLLDFMRNEGAGDINAERMIDTLFSSLDQIKETLSNIQSGTAPVGMAHEKTVGEIRSLLPQKEFKAAAAPSVCGRGLNRAFFRSIESSCKDMIRYRLRAGKNVYQISIALSKYCFYRGMDPLILLKNLSSAGEILSVRCSTEHIPSLNEMNPFMLYLDDIWLMLSTEGDGRFINEIFEFALSVGDITAHAITEEEIRASLTNPKSTPHPTLSPEGQRVESQGKKREEGEFTDEDDWGMTDNSTTESEPITAIPGLKSLFFEFMEEANSYLEDIEPLVLNLEKNKNDLSMVNSIFRAFHTLKGNCGYLGFKDIGRICHSAETLLDSIRSNRVPVTQNIIDILLEAVDIVKRLRSALPYNERDRFGLTDEELNRYPQCEAVDAGPIMQKIETFLTLSSAADNTKAIPRLGEMLVTGGVITEDQLNHTLGLQERRLGEILVEEGIVPEDKVKVALEIQEYKKSLTKASTGAIKVDTEKIDSLVNLAGELVITQTLISQNPSITNLSGQGLQKDITHLGKITREIQDQVMSMRMLPLRQTFQKMMRVVRDVAKKAGKEVELLISGEDTELDKTVIEEISDPLIHLLRNAVDHGIEHPEERKEKGKPEKGVILLNAFQRGGNIVIEIRDDGRGFCREKIVEKAIERGLINEASDITEQQIYHLIFQPGFSTAERVTDISGRGVGMDVVRKNIEKLRGRIDIESSKGLGAAFSITLPLTLAIIDGMVVQAGCEKYIIPTLSIVESFRPERKDVITVQDRGELCNLRESLLPLVRLNRLFHIEPKYDDPWEALLVVVESDNRRACLMVDELIGQQQVVIKTLGDTFKKIKGISGGAILGDGRVGLILDVRGLTESYLN